MKILKKIGKILALINSFLMFLLIIIIILLHSGKSLINRENLSDYVKNAEILNIDLNLVFNQEESSKTLKEEIYQLGLDSNIPEKIMDDILESEELNLILGDFFSKTIDYLVNGLNQPQLSDDAINKMIAVAETSLENHINIMIDEEQLDEYIVDYCEKLTEIVPERQEIIGDLPISSIRTFLNFNSGYLYLILSILFGMTIIFLWSFYKPLKYLAIPMIIVGVLFVVLGSTNNFINSIIISRITTMETLLSPLITILLTIWFKIGVLFSFSGIFLLIIYTAINRIIINHKTK